MRLLGSQMRWPEFAWLLRGLLRVDSRLSRHFAPPERPDPEGGESDGG